MRATDRETSQANEHGEKDHDRRELEGTVEVQVLGARYQVTGSRSQNCGARSAGRTRRPPPRGFCQPEGFLRFANKVACGAQRTAAAHKSVRATQPRHRAWR